MSDEKEVQPIEEARGTRQELEVKLRNVRAEADAYYKELRELSAHTQVFTGAGLNHAASNGQIVLFLNGRAQYLSGKDARTLYHALGGVLDGLPDRFFTDYGTASANPKR